MSSPSVKPSKSCYFSEGEKKQLSLKYNKTELLKVSPPSKWQTSEILGQGSFGCVLFAVNLETGELMAMKQISLIEFYLDSAQEDINEIEQEVEILSRLNHKNIVRYLGTRKDEKSLNIFMEYVSGGTISSLISKYGKISENLMKVYAQQILQGLEYLHHFKYLHRDIKGANVLITNDGVCKLADFGCAKRLIRVDDRSQIFSLKGTTNWMAPEVMRQDAYGRFADIWSFGCLMVEMATGKPPWYYKTNQIQIFMHVCTTEESPNLPDTLSSVCQDFILSCFKRNPSDRLNAHKLLNHPFLRSSITPSVRVSPKPSIDCFSSWSSKYKSNDLKTGKVSSFVISPLDETLEPAVNLADIKKQSISGENFEEMNPEHAVKGPFNDIITTAKFKIVKQEDDGIICLNRPSDEGIVYLNRPSDDGTFYLKRPSDDWSD
jgi:serine/threonine protein kinase